jgi:hypothetical protein
VSLVCENLDVGRNMVARKAGVLSGVHRKKRKENTIEQSAS